MLANKNVSASELFDVLRRVDAQRRAEYFICVPVNPVDTGQAERTGPLFVLDATVTAAHERLDAILAAMRDIGLSADGELGDYRPLRALGCRGTAFPARPTGDRRSPLGVAAARHGRQSASDVPDPGSSTWCPASRP